MQNKAYLSLMKQTEKPVAWAYEAWDELVEGLTHKDNRIRAICGQLLGDLGKSDPKGRMFKDFDKLLNVTRDGKCVTARHTMQNIWKVGLGGKNAQQLVVKGLEKSEGWWNRIVAGDFTGDGRVDFVVGNLGLNTRLKASATEPATMLVKDFDGNGFAEQVVACYKETSHGKE